MEILFTLIIGSLIYFENKIYRTILTPFSILGTIYICLILITNFLGTTLGFYKVSYSSICYIMIFLVTIFFISIIMNIVSLELYKDTILQPQCIYISRVIENRKIIVFTFVICLLCKYISLIKAIDIYGIYNIKGKESGIFAHIGMISVVMAPYIFILYSNNRKRLIYLILILLLYVNLIIFGGKYEIILLTLHIFFFYLANNEVRSKGLIKLGCLVVLISILIFVLIYAIKPSFVDGHFNFGIFKDSLLFSLRHYLYYLISPVIATNYYFVNNYSLSINVEILFTVPINIVKALLGTKNYINPINTQYVKVSEYYKTNVGGLFAECTYYTNFVITSIYIICFFVIVYYFYNKSKYMRRMKALNALLLSVVFVMFFCNFLTVSSVVLNIIYLYIIELVLYNNICINGDDNE